LGDGGIFEAYESSQMIKRTRLLLLSLGALAVVALGAWLQRSWHPWGILTTVDPRILGLVGTTSMEVIELGMHNRRVDVRDGPREKHGSTSIKTPIDKQIRFRLPAAYVTVIDLRDGPERPQRLGFAFWLPSGDPYTPVEIKHSQLAEKERKPGQLPPGKLSGPSPFDDYKDQVAIRMEIGSFQLATDEQLQNIVTRGVFREWAKGRPCLREDIPSRDIVRFSPPTGSRPTSSCVSGGEADGFLLVRMNDAQSALYSIQCNRRGGQLSLAWSLWHLGFRCLDKIR
jgi:hypothetical protein